MTYLTRLLKTLTQHLTLTQIAHTTYHPTITNREPQ